MFPDDHSKLAMQHSILGREYIDWRRRNDFLDGMSNDRPLRLISIQQAQPFQSS